MTTRRTALALVLAVAATVTVFAGAQDFVVTNKTGFAITELYVSPSAKNDWEEDVLGTDVLENGKSTTVTFEGYGDKVCKFDIKIVDEDDEAWVIEKIDLCATHKVTFKKQGDSIAYIQE